MRLAFLLLPVLAAACAGLTTPVPTAARLSQDRLTVTLSNGEICTGPRPAGQAPARGWSGTLQGCGQALPYEVRMDPHRNLLQGLLVELFGAVGAKGLLAPGGEVRVTDARGTPHVFVSPPQQRLDH